MAYKKFKVLLGGSIRIEYYNDNGIIIYLKNIVKCENSEDTFISNEKFYKDGIIYNDGKPSSITYYSNGNIKNIIITSRRGFKLRSANIPNTISFDKIGNIIYQCIGNKECWYNKDVI